MTKMFESYDEINKTKNVHESVRKYELSQWFLLLLRHNHISSNILFCRTYFTENLEVG